MIRQWTDVTRQAVNLGTIRLTGTVTDNGIEYYVGDDLAAQETVHIPYEDAREHVEFFNVPICAEVQ